MKTVNQDKCMVAIVVDTLARGGAEKVALAIANHTNKNRFTPILITTRTPGEMIGDLKANVGHFSLNRRKRFEPAAFRKFARFLDERDIAIVHSHNHSTSYFCRVARHFCKKRWKHIVHDHHGPAVNSWKTTILDKVFLKNVDRYIGVSKVLTKRAHSVIGLPENRCIYLPNGIAIAEYAEKTENGVPVIVQTGRIEPVKNQMMAIGIAGELKKRGVQFKWQFVGKVNNKEYYQKLLKSIDFENVQDCIEFLGERDDVSEILQKSSLGVLTSIHEGLSIALLEYMAHSLPVVITDVGESSDIIKASGGGFVVPQQGKIDAAERISNLLGDKHRMSKFRRNNRQHAEQFYSLESMMNKIMNIYEVVTDHA